MRIPFHIPVLVGLMLGVAVGCDPSAPVGDEGDDPPYEGPTIADPFVQIIFPSARNLILNDSWILAEVTDEDEITEVRFTVDGELIGTLQEEPWTLRWETEPWADGRRHQVRVGATDVAGNTGHAQIAVAVLDPVPSIRHTINQTDTTADGTKYEAVIELTRPVKLDSVWIRELEGADWVAVHSREFGGELLEARTPVEMPGGGGDYTMVAPIYEITVFGRTAVYTERPFEVVLRGSF